MVHAWVRTMTGKTRITAHLPTGYRHRIKAIQARSKADTVSEVIRRALDLYERAVDAGSVFIPGADGELREVLL